MSLFISRHLVFLDKQKLILKLFNKFTKHHELNRKFISLISQIIIQLFRNLDAFCDHEDMQFYLK